MRACVHKGTRSEDLSLGVITRGEIGRLVRAGPNEMAFRRGLVGEPLREGAFMMIFFGMFV